MQDSGSLAVLKVTARDQSHYKGPLRAFVTYCNISCFLQNLFNLKTELPQIFKPILCTNAMGFSPPNNPTGIKFMVYGRSILSTS